MTRAQLVLIVVVLGCCPITTRAQTSYPMVSRIEPTAIQRGTTIELTLAGGAPGGGGGDFSGAHALLCQPPGLSALVLGVEQVTRPANRPRNPNRQPRKPTNVVKVRLTAAANAPLGPREVRVATSQGVSSVGLVVVVNDPVVSEADDKANDEAKGGQAIPLPCVVAGCISKPEDVDWYSFPAKAGERITFSVWANRLENKIHDLQAHFDPILVLFDANGRELAANDNHDFADPLLSYEFKTDGIYSVQVRDTTYSGNLNWTYALHATAGPVATSIAPLAMNPGEKATLHAHGPNIDPTESIAFDVPRDLANGAQLVSFRTSRGLTLPAHVVVTRLPIVEEHDDTPDDPDKAQALSHLPAAIAGTLATANDVDSYRFDAKKGERFSFEVVARRAGAATDPVLSINSSRNGKLAEADDTQGLGKDCRLDWTAPDSGTFSIRLTDLHSRGGDGFGYVILCEPSRPDFSFQCDPDKLNVGPGGRVPLFVQVTRRGDFSGPVSINLGPLPPGVSASPLTIGPKMTQGVVVVSAAKDAKPAAMLLAIRGTAETNDGTIVREVTPKQEIYMPGGGRSTFPVDTFGIGVTEPSDIIVEATPRTISLTAGGTATIDVTVTRKEGFEQGVNLAVVLQHLGGIHANPLPPGVSVREAGSKTLLGPKETKGRILLQAAPGAAAIDGVPICVMGHVSINFVVKTAFASEPILLGVGAEKRP
jgi:hypothetical protein